MLGLLALVLPAAALYSRGLRIPDRYCLDTLPCSRLAGIVDDEPVRYIIACFLPLKEETAESKLKVLSRRVVGVFRTPPALKE